MSFVNAMMDQSDKISNITGLLNDWNVNEITQHDIDKITNNLGDIFMEGAIRTNIMKIRI